jgi:hypothetical protein
MNDNKKTAKNEEDEKMALLEKIKDASNGPEQVGRRVSFYFLFFNVTVNSQREKKKKRNTDQRIRQDSSKLEKIKTKLSKSD